MLLVPYTGLCNVAQCLIALYVVVLLCVLAVNYNHGEIYISKCVYIITTVRYLSNEL